MKKAHVQLSETDREYLQALTQQADLKVRMYKRARGLLELDQGKTYQAVSEVVQVTPNTLSQWSQKYKREGLACLQDKPRPGRPPEIDGLQRAKVTALACSDAPEGYDRWSLRLLADKAVELKYCQSISHTSVGQILKKTTSNPISDELGALVN